MRRGPNAEAHSLNMCSMAVGDEIDVETARSLPCTLLKATTENGLNLTIVCIG